MTEKITDISSRKYLIDEPQMMEMMVDGFFGNIPHASTLGIEFVSIERSRSCLKIPYKKELAGNPESGTIHGGVILSIMDSVGGMAVFAALPAIEAIATLDLRVDYMKPAIIGKAVYASAECYKLTNTIAFVRGVAYQDDVNDPVATCAATFMRGSSHAVAITAETK